MPLPPDVPEDMSEEDDDEGLAADELLLDGLADEDGDVLLSVAVELCANATADADAITTNDSDRSVSFNAITTS